MTDYARSMLAEVCAFLGAVKAQAASMTDDPQRAAAIERNILRLNGLPRDVQWPADMQEAIEANAGVGLDDGPQVVLTAGAGCDKHHNPYMERTARPKKTKTPFLKMEDLRRLWIEHHENRKLADEAAHHKVEALSSDATALQFANRFIELLNGGLRAEAWAPGASGYINGVYRGRIPSIDPVRYDIISPVRNTLLNHNMTNITYPSLNEEEDGDEDSGLDLDSLTEDEWGIELGPVGELGEFDIEEGLDDDSDEAGEEDQTVDSAFGPDAQELKTYGDAMPSSVRPIVFDATTIVAAKVEPSEWWKRQTKEAKRRYIERHPGSRYAKAFRKAVAAKRAKAKAGTTTGKKGRKVGAASKRVSKRLDFAAQENGILKPTDEIPIDLSPEQDAQLDELLQASDEDQDGKIETDEDDGVPPPIPQLDSANVHKLDKAAAHKGFFKPVVNSIKQRVSKSTLGSLARFARGNMKPGDEAGVAAGLQTAAAAIMVVGVAAGVGLVFGPGMMAQFTEDYINHIKSGGNADGSGFDFGSAADEKEELEPSDNGSTLDESAEEDEELEEISLEEDEDSEPKTAQAAANEDQEEDSEDEAAVTDDELAGIAKGFVAWLVTKNKQQESEA